MISNRELALFGKAIPPILGNAQALGFQSAGVAAVDCLSQSLEKDVLAPHSTRCVLDVP
jgi:hypothetical protein